MAKETKWAELARLIECVEQAKPKASLMYAQIVMGLLDAPDRTMQASDLSEAIGRGRDSTAVQQAVGFLTSLGLTTRELITPTDAGGRYYLVKLVRT